MKKFDKPQFEFLMKFIMEEINACHPSKEDELKVKLEKYCSFPVESELKTKIKACGYSVGDKVAYYKYGEWYTLGRNTWNNDFGNKDDDEHDNKPRYQEDSFYHGTIKNFFLDKHELMITLELTDTMYKDTKMVSVKEIEPYIKGDSKEKWMARNGIVKDKNK